MSKCHENRRNRIKRAKKNQQIEFAKALATVLQHIQQSAPEGDSQFLINQKRQRILIEKKNGVGSLEMRTLIQSVHVLTTKINFKRLFVLEETIIARVDQYLGLERQIPITPGQQAVQFRQQMDQILPVLCRDWCEYKQIFKLTTGGQNLAINTMWLNDRCSNIGCN